MEKLNDFRNNLHPSTQVLSEGTAEVLGHTVAALETRNLYGQRVVWGFFGCNRGKFKGGFSNDAASEGVVYKAN